MDLKLFQVYECDDYGEPKNYLGVFRASSKQSAKEAASKYYNNKEIISTGFYDAAEISVNTIKNIKDKLLEELESKTKIRN